MNCKRHQSYVKMDSNHALARNFHLNGSQIHECQKRTRCKLLAKRARAHPFSFSLSVYFPFAKELIVSSLAERPPKKVGGFKAPKFHSLNCGTFCARRRQFLPPNEDGPGPAPELEARGRTSAVGPLCKLHGV